MPRGPVKEQEYGRIEFYKPRGPDFEAYRKFMDMLNHSKTVQYLKETPQYIALRADSNVPPIAGIIGGKKNIGVYDPKIQTPEVYINNVNGKPVITISEPAELLDVQILHLIPNNGSGNNTWSNVSKHPDDFGGYWKNLIEQ